MTRDPPRVAVIGAGISGIVSAAHLRAAGIQATVFERSTEAGGVWIYDKRLPVETSYPATLASQGDTYQVGDADEASFAPPSPCYIGLQNNVATRLMRTTLSAWPAGTEDYVSHHVLKDYIQSISRVTGVHDSTVYGARVTLLQKTGERWRLQYAQLPATRSQQGMQEHHFDAVIVASGHYHAPRVPDIPGLKEWRSRWPSRVWHSKSYRDPELYRDKTVLLIGGGTSSTDIARELGATARRLYQSTRNGLFDFPATMLPENGVRIGEIATFDADWQNITGSADLRTNDAIPATVTLKSGQKLCNVDYVIVSTGYLLSLPFLPHLHDDNMPIADASKDVLVTDGSQIHNLHKDIFYMSDPSLIFVGIPYFSATFTLFEFQAMAVAAVLSGKAALPSEKSMREEYEARVKLKGYGKPFHSVRGHEEVYVRELLDWVNAEAEKRGLSIVKGHTEEWHEAKKDQMAKMQAIFATVRNADRGDTAPEPVLLAAC